MLIYLKKIHALVFKLPKFIYVFELTNRFIYEPTRIGLWF